MRLNEYQAKAHGTAKSDDIEVSTLGLFGEAGSVASSIKKLKRDNAAEEVVKEEIATELGDVLWYLAEIATHYDIKLSDVAASNLKKARYLFEGDDSDFDERAPPDQRLPLKASIEFNAAGEKVALTIDGVQFGDPLDDNAHQPDGYRFHDVFHLAFMTRLGWSPTIRGLIKRKRKYNKRIDRVEDGARARFLEEGISVFVFSQNKRTKGGVSSFSDRRNIPFTVLSALKTMTEGVEVSRRDVSAWRDAISMGFRIFDQLMSHKGGIVTCNRETRRMSFRVSHGGR